MLDQSFSVKNFLKIFYSENRKGNYTEKLFFPELVVISKQLLIINQEVKEKKKLLKNNKIKNDEFQKFIKDKISQKKILQEEKLKKLESFYSQKIGDKYTPYKRFMLKVQSGCTQNCSYCIVPQKRPYHFSLPISDAIKTIKKIENDYDEIIITGVNLNQYQYGFSNLIEKILKETKIKLISFGSIPLNCIDDKFLKLIKNYKLRIKNFFHIPIQSGSDHILKLMHRPYDREKIIKTFTSLREVKRRSNPDGIATSANWRTRDDTIDFGTDIIVGFPTETKKDFQDTLDICKQIGFKKIHTFRYSPRPDTEAKDLFESSPKITKEELKSRSVKIRNAIRTS